MRKNFLFLLALLILLAMLLAACSPTATPNRGAETAPTTATIAKARASEIAITTPTIASTVAATTTTVAATESKSPLPPTATIAPTTVAAKPSAVPTNVPALPSQPKLTTTPAVIKTADGKEVNMVIELARSNQEQEFGLMGRYQLGENEGMLFIFANITNGAFWMKNTPLPLSIAFINDKKQIVDIQDMKPLSEELTIPKANYLYALEMNQGFFARNSIKVGDTLVLKS